jgi:hypothetical protein
MAKNETENKRGSTVKRISFLTTTDVINNQEVVTVADKVVDDLIRDGVEANLSVLKELAEL